MFVQVTFLGFRYQVSPVRIFLRCEDAASDFDSEMADMAVEKQEANRGLA